MVAFFARRNSDRLVSDMLHHFNTNILGGCHVTAPSYDHLFDLWISLLNDCQKGIPPKEFNSRQKEIANLYRRLDNSEQGDFHRLIREDHDRWKAEMVLRV